MAHPGSVGGQHNGYCEPVLGREGILSIENQHFNVDCSENTDKMSTDASIPDQSVEELPGELDKESRNFYPSKSEYCDERLKSVCAQTICVGPIPMKLVMQTEVCEFVMKAARFCIKSQKEENGVSVAAVELQYNSVEEARESYEGLVALNLPPDVIVRFLYPVHGQVSRCDDIHSQVDPQNSFIALNHKPHQYDCDVILAVIGIDDIVTEANLLKVFPTAVQACVPYSFVLETKKRYAYVEFSTAKEAKKHAAAKIVKINDHAYETVRLKDMRSLEALLEEVGTGLKFKSSVRLQELVSECRHYEDADDTLDTQREELAKGVQNIKETLESIQQEKEESKMAANKRKGSDRSDQSSSSRDSAKKHIPFQNLTGDGLMGPAPPGFVPLNLTGKGIMGYPPFGFLNNEDVMMQLASEKARERGAWADDQGSSDQGYDGYGQGCGQGPMSPHNVRGFQGPQMRNRGPANEDGFGFNMGNGPGFRGPPNGPGNCRGMGDGPGMGNNRMGVGNFPQGPMGNMGRGGGGMPCMNSAANMARNQDRPLNAHNFGRNLRNNQNNNLGGGRGCGQGYSYSSWNSNQGNQNAGYGGPGRHMNMNNSRGGGWKNNW